VNLEPSSRRPLRFSRFNNAILTNRDTVWGGRQPYHLPWKTFAPPFSPIIEKLNREDPFYVSSVIPGGTYKGIPQDIRTLGVVATLVTTADVPVDVIYGITKAYFENLEILQALSPLFLSLTKDEMVETGLAAPIHEGALKYFSEVGLK
jgi:hypothetical protein